MQSGEIKPVFDKENIKTHTIKLPNGREVFFVLFDEIEEANDSLHKLLLGPLDKGDLVLGSNEQVDFKNAVMVFTSNLGNPEVAKSRKRSIGFVPSGTQLDPEREKAIRLKAFEEKFPSKLKGRLGGEQNIVVFNSLDKNAFKSILDKDTEEIVKNFKMQGCNISMELTDGAKEWFLSRGTDQDTGARNLAAVIDQEIVQRIARASVDPTTKVPSLGQVNGKSFVFDVKNGGLLFLEKEKPEVAKGPGKSEEDIKKSEMAAAYEKLPGKELWPGFKLDAAPDVVEELQRNGKLVIDFAQQRLYTSNVNLLKDNQSAKWQMLINGSSDDGRAIGTAIYAKIARRGPGAYELTGINSDGSRYRELLIGNICVKKSDF